MKITFLDNKLDLNSGGSNRSLDLLAQGLTNKNHNVSVITVSSKNQNNIPDNREYSVTNICYSNQLMAAKKVYKTLFRQESDTDIFHLYNPAYIPFGGLYRKRGGTTPVVGRLNNYSMFCTNRQKMSGECYKNCTISDKYNHAPGSNKEKIPKLPNYIFQSTVQSDFSNSVDRIFALSPAVKEVYVANGIDKDLIDIIPNFYDNSFKNNTDRGNKHPSSPYQALYVGRLVDQKGIDILIQAILHVDIDIEVTIVGDGPQASELRAMTNDLDLNEKITFTGWIEYDELSTYYRSSDIFVHPGRWPEPFGRTLLEAMQYHVPLIVSDVGGPPWVVDESGEVFESENPVDLSQKMTSLLTNNRKYKNKKEQCVERLLDFKPKRVVNLLESEYRSLIEK